MANELGLFLRSRREALSPTEVGLPVGARRRTPGLRRAELATLAGVSVDYLIRIEQGRDRHPSPQVLAALADALRLAEDDLDHLRMLSAVASGPELCPAAHAPARTVRPTIQTLLGQLEPAPAYVVNHLGDLLAWTEGFDRLARPLGILDGNEPNLAWFTFTDARARTVYLDWAEVADDQAANLHFEARGPADDVRAFADRLARVVGDEFARRWNSMPAARSRTGVRAVSHPEVGLLRLSYELLELPDPDRQRMVVYLPADSATSSGLDRLNGRQPGALRSVRAG